METAREQRIIAVVIYPDGQVETHLVKDWPDLWLKIAGRQVYSIDAHKTIVEVARHAGAEERQRKNV